MVGMCGKEGGREGGRQCDGLKRKRGVLEK